MNVIEGFRYATWEGGYGDFRGRPDLSTLRVTPWLEKTALVLCDVVDHHGEPVRGVAAPGAPAPVGPGRGAGPHGEVRLRAGVLRLRPALRRPGPRAVPRRSPSTRRPGTTSTTTCSRPPRTSRSSAPSATACSTPGCPVEFSKGEAAPGPARDQPALRRRADDGGQPHHLQERRARRSRTSRASRSPSWRSPRSISPGPAATSTRRSGASTTTARCAPTRTTRPTMSPIFRSWMGGILAHSRELSLCFAPFVNSYKRYQPDSWAPTAVVWSPDNRTCGLRLVGHGPAMRVESRIPGADCNRLHRVRSDHRCGPRRHRPGARLRRPVRRQRLHRTRPGAHPMEPGRGASTCSGTPTFAATSLGDEVHFHLLTPPRRSGRRSTTSSPSGSCAATSSASELVAPSRTAPTRTVSQHAPAAGRSAPRLRP